MYEQRNFRKGKSIVDNMDHKTEGASINRDIDIQINMERAEDR